VVKHKVNEVRKLDFNYPVGTTYFAVYWEHGITGLKYVYPNIVARDEIEAYTIAMKKFEKGAS
jgi:hypothetical protein